MDNAVAGNSAELATRRAGVLALWLAISSEIIIFGTVILGFLLLRWNRPEWAEEMRHLSVAAGAINTLVLLSSSYCVALALAAAEKQDWNKATARLFFTLALGGLFLGIKSWEYGMKFSHGISSFSGGFWSFYFLMTGLHALHVIAGMIALGLLWRRGVNGRLAEVGHRILLCGLYWHLVDIVWIFLFPLLYLS